MTRTLFSKSKELWSLCLWRISVIFGLLVIWEVVGRMQGDGSWLSRPSAIFLRLQIWLAADFWIHLGTTLWEMALGLSIGVPLGVITGLLLGRSPVLGGILRPIIVAIYNVPMIALAPLLILWFGIDLMPKVVLVTVVTYFILFFATFAGSESIDQDLIFMLQLMGASPGERFRKVVLPASVTWIASAMKLALPYALIDAIMGEMLAARKGIGYLLTSAIAQIDMTGVYASLTVMMVIGVSLVAIARFLERRILAWRPTVT